MAYHLMRTFRLMQGLPEEHEEHEEEEEHD
jgi:hypothetical protein